MFITLFKKPWFIVFIGFLIILSISLVYVTFSYQEKQVQTDGSIQLAQETIQEYYSYSSNRYASKALTSDILLTFPENWKSVVKAELTEKGIEFRYFPTGRQAGLLAPIFAVYQTDQKTWQGLREKDPNRYRGFLEEDGKIFFAEVVAKNIYSGEDATQFQSVIAGLESVFQSFDLAPKSSVEGIYEAQ